MNKNQALAAIGEIESLIERFGSPNKDALRTVKAHAFALEGSDGYFNEKLGSLHGWAKIGFSTRKFDNYPGGVQQVRVHALSDCMMLKRLINEWPES